MDGPTDLTWRQQSVLKVIVDYQSQYAIAPTVREIAAHLGLKSPGGIHRILNILKDRGYITSDPAKKRSWRCVRPLPGGGIPVIGEIAAGKPIEAIEHLTERLAISPDIFGRGEFFSLRVRGDSMTGVHIMDGDLAIIRIQKRVESGQIVAVLIEDVFTEATLKILHRNGTVLTLASANQRYKALTFKGVERRRVTIVGQLAGVVRRT